MRKFLPIILILQVLVATAQVGVHTDFPDNSSAMDIVAANKGLLIPRVTLTNSLANPSPVTAPAVGLLVFNSGPNQAIGFYYWNGSTWVLLGGGSSGGGDGWALTGNAGTIPGTNFLGTTDNQHFLVYSNNAERMRFESDGQVIIGGTAPLNSTDLFTVFGNSTQTAAINAYSPRTGFQTNGGRYGILSTVDTATGFTLYARNLDALGYSIVTAGSGYTTVGLIASHTAGVHSQGYDGLHAWGKDANGYGIFSMGSNTAGPFNLSGISAGISTVGNYGIIAKGTAATGRGIVAVGSGQATPSTSLESEGGAFTGYHGVFCKGVNAQGIGVIGIGSNAANYSIISGGLGGSFSGNYGVYGKGLAAEGVGVLGVGSGGSGYYTVTGGSGGAFTGSHGTLSVGVNTTNGTGIIAAGNNGSYNILPNGAGGSFTGSSIGAAGFGTVDASGIGIIGAGNNQSAWVPSNGCGGAFTGNTGIFSRSTNAVGTGIVAAGNNVATINTYANGTGGAFTGATAGIVSWGIDGATGTGVIGSGNNITAPLTYTTGSGGAFTGTNAGNVSWATGASGTGVIGAGNNVAPLLHTGGSGGAFTGTLCGVYGNATATGGTRYGGYFATTNGQYAYVGGRVNNTNQKITGTGAVSTIVTNTNGELITLTCPEAPEVVFQDFGTGELVNGFCHITIDPDLAININVSADHPLKVYITPEGDCNGVYVTNKSAYGFDVKELQGGKSNVPFSWQIVATRANEEYVLRDGTRETSDYSQRFAPAPGPLESVEQPAQVNPMTILDTHSLETIKSGKESAKESMTNESLTLEIKDDQVMRNADNPDE